MYRTLLLPALGALALALAASPGHAATDMNADWQAYEQAYGSNAPPATDADCARYTTDVVRNECMSRMHQQPIFTYRMGDSRANADQAAIRYCTKIGKTYELQGQSADKQLIMYTCK